MLSTETKNNLIGCSLALVMFAALFFGWVWIFQFLWNQGVYGILGFGRALAYHEALIIWLVVWAIGSAFRSTTSSKK